MRTSDTKLLRAWPQARSEFPSVRRITDRRGKTLVLCQHESQGTPRACSSRRRRGSPLYLGRAVTPDPPRGVRSLSWGVWPCAAPSRSPAPACHGVLHTGLPVTPCASPAGRGPRPPCAGPYTSGLRGTRAHALLQPRAGHGRL